FDTKRSFELLQVCAAYRYAYCQYWLARAYHDGAGTARDYTKAYAYFTVAKELGQPDAAGNLQTMDNFVQPDIKTSAAELAKSISGGLKPIPRPIRLEIAETETAGQPPWPDPTLRPASPRSANQAFRGR
ncbi:MAG: SEL1-like repeat protein, partial [Acetobacteraceae bacterium]|nr:SEL1-like repeat protein [Acetobacteraceae bacterium]